MKKAWFVPFLFLFFQTTLGAQDFDLIHNDTGSPVYYKGNERVVETAIDLFLKDSKLVCTRPGVRTGQITNRSVIVGIPDQEPQFQELLSRYQIDYSGVSGKWESFRLTAVKKGKESYLFVIGSDSRGAAYGVLELSRRIGVSPWVWWADALPERRTRVTLASDNQTHSPSVQFRGIFINDEDWGLMPWSNQTYEPSDRKGRIGPLTHQRIFELLLRLRANTLWPAMHECSLPFYLTEGNKETADAYGIYIGTSHCEPMMRNAAGEWRIEGKGDYDYVNNSEAVFEFWEKRVKDVAGRNNIYTLGMRGVHDGQMQGAKTIEEQKAVLERVLKDQRGLLKKYVNEDLTTIPQAFIPYKEVLDIYNAGLKVPDDVTLMWCDDNYGYIRHFPTPEERARKGGNGMYYHVSYWGRPHDYLWLGSTHPALIYQQMKLAYEEGVRKTWIVNVGDIKPCEYLTELFLDMAWNIEEISQSGGVNKHLYRFLEREFGKKAATALLSVMQEYYRLAHIRKPEFMGNTREEERDPKYRIVCDLPWSESYIRERMNSYKQLSDKVEQLAEKIPSTKKDAYFQLAKYPVQGAAQLNKKLLTAQLARHGKTDWDASDAAFDSMAVLTRHYNALNHGKWNRMMDFQPRKLPVFNRVKRETVSSPMTEERPAVHVWNGSECKTGNPVRFKGLGYEGKAASLKKGASLAFEFKKWEADSIKVEIRLLPNHPIHGKQLRFTLSLDGGSPQIVSYETKGRSEEWKENVLRNQAIRRLTLPVSSRKSHQLVITAQDEGVILDQVLLYAP